MTSSHPRRLERGRLLTVAAIVASLSVYAWPPSTTAERSDFVTVSSQPANVGDAKIAPR